MRGIDSFFMFASSDMAEDGQTAWAGRGDMERKTGTESTQMAPSNVTAAPASVSLFTKDTVGSDPAVKWASTVQPC